MKRLQNGVAGYRSDSFRPKPTKTVDCQSTRIAPRRQRGEGVSTCCGAACGGLSSHLLALVWTTDMTSCIAKAVNHILIAGATEGLVAIFTVDCSLTCSTGT